METGEVLWKMEDVSIGMEENLRDWKRIIPETGRGLTKLEDDFRE